MSKKYWKLQNVSNWIQTNEMQKTKGVITKKLLLGDILEGRRRGDFNMILFLSSHCLIFFIVNVYFALSPFFWIIPCIQIIFAATARVITNIFFIFMYIFYLCWKTCLNISEYFSMWIISYLLKTSILLYVAIIYYSNIDIYVYIRTECFKNQRTNFEGK